MWVAVDIVYGKEKTAWFQACKLDKQIEALQNAIDGKPYDKVLAMDAMSIFAGIKDSICKGYVYSGNPCTPRKGG